MSYYATDDDISAMFFNGETVPGDNTVPNAVNTSFKTRANNRVNMHLGRSIEDGNADDDYGALKEAFLFVYGVLLSGGDLFSKEVTESLNKILGINGDIALSISYEYDDVYNRSYYNGRFW